MPHPKGPSQYLRSCSLDPPRAVHLERVFATRVPRSETSGAVRIVQPSTAPRCRALAFHPDSAFYPHRRSMTYPPERRLLESDERVACEDFRTQTPQPLRAGLIRAAAMPTRTMHEEGDSLSQRRVSFCTIESKEPDAAPGKVEVTALGEPNPTRSSLGFPRVLQALAHRREQDPPRSSADRVPRAWAESGSFRGCNGSVPVHILPRWPGRLPTSGRSSCPACS